MINYWEVGPSKSDLNALGSILTSFKKKIVVAIYRFFVVSW